ncbi:MAG TPA: M17 family peptidase N-terminal domain-containing protein [Polyangiaceae bacterium]|nr:M17 family peptidase N-terminal domain-containing protein [Polyangiaceae bacterium]
MDLRFTTPSLRRLDLAGTEVLVATLAEDERPPHGVAGLVDFRLAGRISRLLRRGFATGKLGEVVLVAGKPKLPFDKVLLFGVGPKASFGEAVFGEVVEKILTTLENLRARAAVVELPGRPWDGVPPERAADLLLERAGNRREHDVWTLVDTSDAQRLITQHMVQERRRIRDE